MPSCFCPCEPWRFHPKGKPDNIYEEQQRTILDVYPMLRVPMPSSEPPAASQPLGANPQPTEEHTHEAESSPQQPGTSSQQPQQINSGSWSGILQNIRVSIPLITMPWSNEDTVVDTADDTVSSDSLSGSVHGWSSVASGEVARDPPPSTDSAIDRLELLIRGTKLTAWIENPNEPSCFVQPCSLTFDKMKDDCTLVERQNTELPSDIRERPETFPEHLPGAHLTTNYTYFEARFHEVTWLGRTGPDTLVLQSIARSALARLDLEHNPYVSEISTALFARDHLLEDLRFIFVTGVVNAQTVQLFSQLDSQLTDWDNPQVWQYRTEPYYEIMGTRIGRVVAYFLLGAFPRGTRSISNIVSWSDDMLIMIRFDVAPIPEEQQVQFSQAGHDRIFLDHKKDEERADFLPDDPLMTRDMRYFMTNWH